MRTSVRHHRPRHRRIQPWPQTAPPLEVVAARCRYVGSPEHKAYPSPAGPPALRSDAARCPAQLVGEHLADGCEGLTPHLRDAILLGAVGEEIGGYPKYVWVVLDGDVYEARHINGPIGDYKGYRLEPAEYPEDPRGVLVLP
jgi:hypothetical protein